jgi:hypothetical protein
MLEKIDRDLLFNLALLCALVLVYLATLFTAARVPALADKVQDFALGTVTGGILAALQRGRSGSDSKGSGNDG